MPHPVKHTDRLNMAPIGLIRLISLPLKRLKLHSTPQAVAVSPPQRGPMERRPSRAFRRRLPSSWRAAQRSRLHIGTRAVPRVAVSRSNHAALELGCLAVLRIALAFARQPVFQDHAKIPAFDPPARHPVLQTRLFCHSRLFPVSNVFFWGGWKWPHKAPQTKAPL